MSKELDGQVAIVTGAGRGIGEGIALGIGRAGAAVVAVSRTRTQLDNTVALIEKEGGRAIAVAADVKLPGEFDRVVAEAEARFGPVELLVNNAAVIEPMGQSWEVDLDLWREAMDINVLGPLLGARAVLPGMVERGRGRIVNVSSGVIYRPLKYGSAYSVSKIAMTRLTESLAVETAGTGVGVFNLDPGQVQTDMPDIVDRWEAEQDWLPAQAPSTPNYLPAEAAAGVCVLIATGATDALSGRMFGVNDDIPQLIREAERIERENFYRLGMKTLRA